MEFEQLSDQLKGTSPLHEAARMGHTEVVKALISAGADIHALDENGKTPLHEAARMGHIETVQLLIAVGADINPKKGMATHRCTRLLLRAT
jgi:cytohesin